MEKDPNRKVRKATPWRPIERPMKQLDAGVLPTPDFVEGNLCDPRQVLSPEELRARDIALDSLARARVRDELSMRTIAVD